MNENINLCKILKGHEGETFYSHSFGEVKLGYVSPIQQYIRIDYDNSVYRLTIDGKIYEKGELDLFPSKNQRDWNKWVEEQKLKVPKTWSDMKECEVEVFSYMSRMYGNPITPIVKSAIALLKIYQLIEKGYGGNVTRSDYIDIHKKAWGIDYDFLRDEFHPSTICYSLVAFHTEEQAREFLSYSENIQLLKDYFMI